MLQKYIKENLEKEEKVETIGRLQAKILDM